ncbi:MAG: alpha/beta fold hydrolase [Sandaracinaceae bacterium]|jgi:predicted alpha/beta-fold hydrolase|nr:alpha/beta fold hydrolase [Sandaracinaceae bacterium]MBK7154600.1 alpha/beta fold hydrolase [Sandaracinaceae bacterium]MBK7775504.1 alpha/beta fold hydrolase [Sandaracinaceae bacterium]
MDLHGHVWTFRPYVAHMLRPKAPPPSRHFRTYLDDPVRGRVRLTGRLTLPSEVTLPSETDLVVAIHGLGGSHRSHYMVEIAHDALALGHACLRVNLRGADRHGTDYYHAGLTADVVAVLQSPEVLAFRRVFLLGYSLGGHVSLRHAAEGACSNVAGVAAFCPPIDLAGGVVEIDKPKGRIYRRTVLRGLKDIYRGVAQRSEVPFDVKRADAIDTIREWDERIIAPRHGFASADDYYARTTVAPILHQVTVPTLVVATSKDPMVFAHIVRPHLEECSAVRTVFLDRGGHVGFPRGTQLGHGDSGSVATQALRWLQRRAGDTRASA